MARDETVRRLDTADGAGGPVRLYAVGGTREF